MSDSIQMDVSRRSAADAAGERRWTSRKWRLRGLAILLGLLPVVAAELTLRALGLPRQSPRMDPFVDLNALEPLFVRSAKTGDAMRMSIGEERMNLFRPASFEMPKPPATFRVFALGGSTTQGEPYSTETAFPKWLELSLQAALPERRVEVVNCGGLSYASYRVLAVLREVIEYQPDLVVVYTGQNEFLERRTYDGYEPGTWLSAARGRATQLRLVQVLRNSLVGATPAGAARVDPLVRDPTQLAREVDALLDYRGGLDDYRRGELQRVAVVDHLAWNVSEMIATCRDHKLPIALVAPVTNLLDCPPMKFEWDPRLTEEQRAQAEQLWQAARARSGVDRQAAMEACQAALAIDDGHAGAWFLLGRLQYEQGDYPQALSSLRSARDTDVCPLRATSAIRESILSVAAERGTPTLDADDMFSELSPHGIVGERWLVDHIHPSINGNQLLGRGLAEHLVASGIIEATREDWHNGLERVFAEHLSSLNEAYFHRGKQRLEGLLLWTEGRAKKVREAAE